MNTRVGTRRSIRGLTAALIPFAGALIAILVLIVERLAETSSRVDPAFVPLVAAVAAVLLALGILMQVRSIRSLGQTVDTQNTAETNEVKDHQVFLQRVRESAMAGEDAGRKLGTQVGETLSAITSISTEASLALLQANDLAEQVEGGASAMEQISATIASLGQQVQRQNDLVDQSAAAVEQMSASIASVAEVAEGKRQASERLVGYTSTGSQKITVSEQAIREVSTRVESVNGMLKVINTIAAQTNLLAMNAAIEAAHAGSYGRGFAVVANEIRNLAESTTNQAREIGQDLKELVGKIDVATDATDSAGEAFRTIEEEAQAVSAAFAEITNSTRELAAGASEVVETSADLRDLSSQTAESAEEMKAGAGELSGLLVQARGTAAGTRTSMETINRRSGTITIASNRIAELTRKNNKQIGSLLTLIAEIADEAREEPAAVRRLEISNAILSHMSWVASLRSRLDGEISGSQQTEYPVLAWLDTASEQTISSEDVARIREPAAELAQLGAQAIALHDQTSSDEAENAFKEVLSRSVTILEQLSGQLQDEEFRWTPSLSVSVEEFDVHHQRLFALINGFYKAMKRGEAQGTIEKTFDELLEYTSYHFNAEEKALDAVNFPMAEEHRAQHQIIVERATELRKELGEGKQLVALEVTEFLRDWIVDHIKKHDMSYTSYLRPQT